MTPGDCFREAAEICSKHSLDWRNNVFTATGQARAGTAHDCAIALLARAAEEDSRAQPEFAHENQSKGSVVLDSHPTPEAAALADELNEAFSEGQEARFERLCQENGRAIINALRGKGKS